MYVYNIQVCILNTNLLPTLPCNPGEGPRRLARDRGSLEDVSSLRRLKRRFFSSNKKSNHVPLGMIVYNVHNICVHAIKTEGVYSIQYRGMWKKLTYSVSADIEPFFDRQFIFLYSLFFLTRAALHSGLLSIRRHTYW